jgi:CspA family cold shock protein
LLTGTVSWFDPRRRTALIQPDRPSGRAGRDILVHAGDLEKAGLNTLQAGQRITFRLEENADGHRNLTLSVS